MTKKVKTKNSTALAGQENFSHIVELIITARNNTLRKINEELVSLYWNIGKHLSRETKKHFWGDKYIDNAANFLKQNHPDLRGFNKRGLERMRRFYETYNDDPIASALLTQLSWANHLLIMSAAKSPKERHFYIKKSIEEKWTYRELDRQLESAYFQRAALSENKALPANMPKDRANPFLDTYVLEFLNLPGGYTENDLQNALVENMKNFLLEIGKDFSFLGKEIKIQVGNSDFFLDLLFFHRGLQCLVAFELKRGKFTPEYISKMDFYLEALDRDYKKPNENPSVGIILCATADEQVVEYAMSRTISPTLVSKYRLELPDKKLLKKRLCEISNAMIKVKEGKSQKLNAKKIKAVTK
ncbi:MAG: PDDEXK nuclease domain-containing protein [Chitinispirillales bacterium]|jgi:predicted nuclease of restriction endonuclease-like (RecB) superfamily|nr:PDDEXK nuclease domain-containing protein [Chitinispirillales bacterium]